MIINSSFMKKLLIGVFSLLLLNLTSRAQLPNPERSIPLGPPKGIVSANKIYVKDIIYLPNLLFLKPQIDVAQAGGMQYYNARTWVNDGTNWQGLISDVEIANYYNKTDADTRYLLTQGYGINIALNVVSLASLDHVTYLSTADGGHSGAFTDVWLSSGNNRLKQVNDAHSGYQSYLTDADAYTQSQVYTKTEADARYLQTIPHASASVLGIIRVGTGLAIDGSGILSTTGSSSGSVVSVTLHDLAPLFTVNGTNLTSTVDYTYSLTATTAHKVWGSGAGTTPGYISLTAADIPSLPESQITNLTSDLAAKANAGTTLAAYGITDAYTKTASDARYLQSITGAGLDNVWGSNGILVRTGAGTYSSITDNSSAWNTNTNKRVNGIAFTGTTTKTLTLTYNDATTTTATFTDNTGTSGTGITSLNGDASTTQSFAFDGTGTDFGITTASGVHTFHLPTGSASARGLLASVDYNKIQAAQPNAYTSISDGTTTATSVGANGLRLRSASNLLGIVVTDNDGTFGDNILFTINQGAFQLAENQVTNLVTDLAAKQSALSAGSNVNQYLGWLGSAYGPRQIAYSELSGTPSAYSLPIASPSVLGGIKVGNMLQIDGTGILALTNAPGNNIYTIQQIGGLVQWAVFPGAGYVVGGDVAINGTANPSGAPTPGTSTINNGVVTYAKIQNVTAQRLLGRYSASLGPAQEITIGAGLSLNNSTGVLFSTAGVPAGVTTEVQWRNGGVFGASTNFLWNSSTSVLTVGSGEGDGTIITKMVKLYGLSMATVADGQLQYDGSHIYFDISTSRFRLDQQFGTLPVTQGLISDFNVTSPSFILLSNITANHTLFLPNPASFAGQQITIKNNNTSGFQWNYGTFGVVQINNVFTFGPIASNGNVTNLISDGSSWYMK
jgi:hypothetical protein